MLIFAGEFPAGGIPVARGLEGVWVMTCFSRKARRLSAIVSLCRALSSFFEA